MEQSPDDNFAFDHWNDNYSAVLDKDNYQCGRSLAFTIPKTTGNTETCSCRKKGGNFYFLVNTIPDIKQQERVLPHHITLLWDVSLSSVYRDTQKEMELLDEYIRQIGHGQITLVSFSNTLLQQKDYALFPGATGGEPFRSELQHMTYDGGTQLGALDLRKLPGEEFLLFSDGHSTFGNPGIGLSDRPVYTINTSSKADYSNLRYIAQKTGGTFINLSELKISEAKRMLLYRSLQFLGVSKPDPALSECYPSLPAPR